MPCQRPLVVSLAALLGVVLLAASAAPTCAAGAGGSLDQWRRERDAQLHDPALLRLYSFIGSGSGNGGAVVDLSGHGGRLAFRSVAPAGEPPEQATIMQGRWPGKGAARMDRGLWEADSFDLPGRAFTVTLWFRKNGPGGMRGNSGATNGTVVSLGNGYWDGWRVTTSYPEGTFGLEIGRPQPSSSVGLFGAGPLPDGVWHHLAATWDGKEMRLYLDGAPAGATPYAGDFTAPKSGDHFRIGFADAGWGSVKLDVDEVAVFGRALSTDEVLRSALFYAGLDEGVAARLVAAGAALAGGDARAAAGAYRRVLSVPALHPDVAAIARMGLAESLRRSGETAEQARTLALVVSATGVSDRYGRAAIDALARVARASADVVPAPALARLLAAPGLPARDRYEIRLAQARAAVGAGSYARGRRLLAALAADPAATDQDRVNLSLAMAHALRAARSYAAARAEYGKLASAPGVPAALRSYAQLLAIRAAVDARDYPSAVSGCRQLLASPELPLSHRMEAEELVAEIVRLRRGLPARDPVRSRVRPPKAVAPAVTLYVAPAGSDANPGTPSRPLASLAGARDAIRALKKRGPLPAGGVAVIVRGGEYRVIGALALTAADAGTPSAPIVYRAAAGESPRFTGSMAVRQFAPVSDAAALARLPEAARGHVLQADLRAQGITDYGALAPHGVGFGFQPVPELFVNGDAMRLARWPNEGWATTGKVTAEKTPEGGFAFEYAGDRPTRWVGAKDAWLLGYWRWLWAEAGVRLASVDTATHELRAANPSSYGIQAGMPFYAYNLLEELDAPGEWYLDRERGVLYLYPPSGAARLTAQFSVLAEPFVRMEGASYITLERLVFEGGRADGIAIQGGDGCVLAGCTVRDIAGTAVTISGGRNDLVYGCDLYTLGRGGVSISGGDRRTLEPSGDVVENCHIYDFSRWDRTYTPAVFANGVGVRIAHNLIHDSPGHAMRLEGNDHMVELNEVHDVVYETDDQGAVDMWFNPSYRGVVLRYNFWHHMGDGRDQRMRAGIRLDDAISGVLIYGNVFWRSAEGFFGAVQIHGGKDNVVDNNLFVQCKTGVSFSGWGAERWKQFVEGSDVVKATTQDVDIRRPPFSTRYPALARLADGEGINSVWRAVTVGGGDLLIRDRGIQSAMDNLAAGGDPGFVNARARDFRLKPDSPVYALTGFRPIPFQEIGLYADPLRASWPVRNPVGTHYHE